jgi:hypothetical protein
VTGLDDLAIHHDAPKYGLEAVSCERGVLSPPQPRVGDQQDLQLAPPDVRDLRRSAGERA